MDKPSEQPDGDGAPAHRITTIEQLEALYDAPVPRSLIKEIDHISEHYRAFIDKAPFVIVATSGPDGLDCSPRGDPPGFVRVVDAKTVLIPDRRGNNQLDTLRNLVHDPRISLLFLIPGCRSPRKGIVLALQSTYAIWRRTANLEVCVPTTFWRDMPAIAGPTSSTDRP